MDIPKLRINQASRNVCLLRAKDRGRFQTSLQADDEQQVKDILESMLRCGAVKLTGTYGAMVGGELTPSLYTIYGAAQTIRRGEKITTAALVCAVYGRCGTLTIRPLGAL